MRIEETRIVRIFIVSTREETMRYRVRYAYSANGTQFLGAFTTATPMAIHSFELNVPNDLR